MCLHGLTFLVDKSTAWSPGLWEDHPFKGNIRESKPTSQSFTLTIIAMQITKDHYRKDQEKLKAIPM